MKMITVKSLNRMGILIALLLIFWGVSPFITGVSLTSEILASSIILVLIGVGYIITTLKPSWNKAVLFIEGIIITFAGGLLLTSPYNILFIIIGLICIIVAVLAYVQKLPKSLLKYFYR